MCCVHNPLGGYGDFQAAMDVQADNNLPVYDIPYGHQNFQGLGILFFSCNVPSARVFISSICLLFTKLKEVEVVITCPYNILGNRFPINV